MSRNEVLFWATYLCTLLSLVTMGIFDLMGINKNWALFWFLPLGLCLVVYCLTRFVYWTCDGWVHRWNPADKLIVVFSIGWSVSVLYITFR